MECPSVKNREREGNEEGRKTRFPFECYNCGKKGHRARECTVPRKATATKTLNREEEREKEEFEKEKGFAGMAADARSVLPFAEAIVGGVKEEAMIDSGAAHGAIVNEDIGSKIQWKVKPRAEEAELGGIMDGALVRWGEATIELGGKKVALPVGMTSALNDKLPILLGNGVMAKLQVCFDWKKRVIVPNDGKEVPFVLKKGGHGAHYVYLVYGMRKGLRKDENPSRKGDEEKETA